VRMVRHQPILEDGHSPFWGVDIIEYPVINGNY
jgi:hypothetical protein